MGDCKMSRSSHLPTSILKKVYTQSSTGFNRVYRLHGLNNTLLSQGYVLENSFPYVGRIYIPRMEKSEELRIV